ncbi:Bug family tripartite tricarboxylate transporter substrate binding protein [Paracidovorax oryzae]|uniref:Bug family tripartite tricarboxylate transporter substrate binding protein n=1 Tax=Paracidovorax oryzae TaxID=862720 RepID=UPI00047E3242|nr:tripartite tricarboxylate transporter substrate binding protein [Paracidovorax oryzae]
MKRKIVAALVAALPLLASAFPERPIKLIVPMAAGSITDVAARSVAEAMSQRLKQPVVVDNQQNLVGTMAAVRAAPDGYTLLIVGITNAATNVITMKSPPYDPRKDFTPIGQMAELPYLLVASTKLPAQTMKDLISYGKSHPDKLSYGYGSGSAQLATVRFTSMANFTATGVGYKGVPQAMTDLMGGTIDFIVADLNNGLQAARAGRVTALGVTSAKRSPLAPDVPTLHEQGLEGYDISVRFGLAGPAHLPASITEQLNAALREALNDPAVRQRFDGAGIAIVPSSPEVFARNIRDDIAKWSAIARDAGIAPQ